MEIDRDSHDDDDVDDPRIRHIEMGESDHESDKEEEESIDDDDSIDDGCYALNRKAETTP
jgi:hypothetical protein